MTCGAKVEESVYIQLEPTASYVHPTLQYAIPYPTVLLLPPDLPLGRSLRPVTRHHRPLSNLTPYSTASSTPASSGRLIRPPPPHVRPRILLVVALSSVAQHTASPFQSQRINHGVERDPLHNHILCLLWRQHLSTLSWSRFHRARPRSRSRCPLLLRVKKKDNQIGACCM
jgi:hypothetical protein